MTDTFWGLLIPFLGTSLGAACVFFMQGEMNRGVERGLTGFASGVMVPANGNYKATMTVWRLPNDLSATQFDGGTNGAIHKNGGQEHPARPTGWYRFSFRFTLQASANVELSAERVEQGGIVGVAITGMAGDTAPTLETDLGSVSCTRSPSGWRAYIPAAYNASAGAHEIRITVNGETISRTLTVLPRDFGTAEVEAEPAPTPARPGLTPSR